MNIETALKIISESEDSQLKLESAELIVGSIGKDDKAVEALVQLLSSNDRGIKDFAARNLSELISENAKTASKLLSPLISDENIELRNLAGDILIRLGEPSAEFLIGYISDANHDSRKFACDILGLINTRQHADKIRPLLQDNDSNVVQSAIEALGNYQDESSIEDLMNIYQNSAEQKPNVIEAFGKIGSERAMHYLFEMLSNEKDDFLKTAVIDSLSLNCENKEIAKRLFETIEDENETIQIIILKTVSAIAFRLGETFVLPQHLRHLSYKALFDDDADIRAAGLLSLGNVFVTDDFPSLFNEMFKNNPDTQSYVLERVLHHNEPELIEKFFKAFCNEVALRSSISCDIDFLSLISYMWEEIPNKNKIATIESIISIIFECRRGDIDSILDLFVKLDRDLTKEKIEECYMKSTEETRLIIKEVSSRYELEINITNN